MHMPGGSDDFPTHRIVAASANDRAERRRRDSTEGRAISTCPRTTASARLVRGQGPVQRCVAAVLSRMLDFQILNCALSPMQNAASMPAAQDRSDAAWSQLVMKFSS